MLTLQVSSLHSEVEILQKREQSLIQQISVPLDKNIQKLLSQLEVQHRELLHQQLLEIKRSYKVQGTGDAGAVKLLDDRGSYIGSDHGEGSLVLHSTKQDNSDTSIISVDCDVEQSLSKEVKMHGDFEGVEGIENEQQEDTGTCVNASIQDSEVLPDNKAEDQEPYVVCIAYSDLPVTKSNNFEVSSTLEMECQDEPSCKRLKTT